MTVTITRGGGRSGRQGEITGTADGESAARGEGFVSCCVRYAGGRLERADARDEPVPPVVEFVHHSFRELVLNPRFACVAGRSAINGERYHFAVYDARLGEADAARLLARDLERFAREQDAAFRDQGFSTFVASFTDDRVQTERQFEAALWDHLQRLHEADAPGQPWDETVSDDPDAADFEFSFGGRAYFIVGMHAGSSRWTRRFAFPTLVFNAHFQFEDLRAAGKYERIQAAVRGRDHALQGSLNPNLADFGEASDARQYSGRRVEREWRCPFRSLHRTPDLTAALNEEEADAEGNIR